MARSHFKNQMLPKELLDDIASRFLLDTSPEDMENEIAVCFLTEMSHWFYLDEYVDEDDTLNNIKFEPFAIQLLNHIQFKPKENTLEELLVQFKEFKQRVPTYGAIILNEDLSHALLAQGFYYQESWGFPKGKVNEEELPHICAIREVLEETGFDIGPYIDPTQFIETIIREQKIRLYIIPKVSMKTVFIPRTKKEIKELKWFPIDQLPSYRDRNYKKKGTKNIFYMAMPFIKPLKEWIAMKTCGSREHRQRRHSSTNGREGNGQRGSNSPAPTPDYRHSFHSAMMDDITVMARPRYNSESGQWKKDNRQNNNKNKNKKSTNLGQNQGGSGQNTEASDEHSKFTFKNRANKSRVNNKYSLFGNEGSSKVYEVNDNYRNQPVFKSQVWASFRLNKKEINDALDRVWRGLGI